MALTYDQISGITQRKFIPKLYDNIFDSNALLKRMKEKSYEKVDGGLSIMVPLNYAKATAVGWYTGAGTLSTTDNDVITSAEYSWKQLYGTINITGLDERKNSGDSAILKLVASKTKIVEKSLADQLGTGLYSNATDPLAIVGLRQIVGTANTIGGISQTTYSWWAGQVDSSTTTLTLAALQTQFNAASIDADHPTVITATRANYNRYYALLQPQQRFVDSESAKGGFASLMFNGVPMLVDSYVPANHIFMINEKNLSLYVHKDADMKFEPFQKPVNQDVKTAKILWMGALGSSNNRLHAKLSGLTA